MATSSQTLVRAPAPWLLIARRELRARLKSFLGWFLPAGGLLAIMASLQPSMAENGSLMEQKLASMPPEMLAAFGIEGQLNLSDPASYLATNFTVVLILGALFAAITAASALAREESSGTAEMLLAAPISRRSVLSGKAVAGLIFVLSFDIAAFLIAVAVFAAVGADLSGSIAALAALFVTAALLHATLYTIALAATAFWHKPRSATGLTMGIVFGLYGLSVVAALSGSLEFIGYLSPFYYAIPGEIVSAGGMTSGSLMLLGVCAAALTTAVMAFDHRDIHA